MAPSDIQKVKLEMAELDSRVSSLERKILWVEAVARARGWNVNSGSNTNTALGGTNEPRSTK